MHEMNLRSLDLNLLVALKALLDEKHVTRAALRVGLSQPAMSRALDRLRKALNDPLLVKGANGFCLTHRANDLYPSLQNIFFEINQIMTPLSPFNPTDVQANFVIATRDYETVTILPRLINYLTKEVPGLKLCIVPLIGDDLTPLDQQEVDIVLTATESSSATLCRSTLFYDGFACLISANNALTQHELTLEKFVNMKHCMVTISGFGPGLVDAALAKLKLKRDVVVRIPHFLAASHIIANTDIIATLPRRIGLLLSENLKIKLLNPPIEMSDFPVYLYWHIRNQNNPLHKWIRNVLRKLWTD